MKFLVKNILSLLAICPFPALSAMAATKIHNLAGEEEGMRSISKTALAGRAIFPANEYVTTVENAKKRIIEIFNVDSNTADEMLQEHINFLSDRNLVKIQENDLISASRSWGRGE